MRRGKIYYANLEPTIGAKIIKVRPVLIVSNNANNKMATTLTTVPITPNTKKVHPFEVLLETKDSGLSTHSKAQCHQVRTISKLRINNKKPIGKVSSEIMKHIETSLKLHLAIC